MHNKRHIAFGRGRQHSGRGETGVVNEQRVFIPLPRHRKGRIGYDQLKGLVVPVLRGDQRILPHDVEFIKLDVMQEHIDAAEVVGGQVDLLPEKPPLDVILAQHLFHLQQQRAGAAGGVIDLVNPCFPDGAEPSQQLRNIRWSKILAAFLACVGGVHTHQVFVSVTEQVGIDAAGIIQRHLRYAVQQFGQHLVPLGHRFPNGFAVHVVVVEQPGKVVFRIAAGGAALNMGKDALQRFVQVFVLIRTGADIAEQFAGQDEKAFFLHQPLTGGLGVFIRHPGIIKVLIPGGVFSLVNISGEVFRNIAVEHRPQHIGLKIPFRHVTCMDQISCNFIDTAEQLVPLLICLDICHYGYSFSLSHSDSISSKGIAFPSQNALIFFIAVILGLVFPFSHRLMVPTDTRSSFAKSSWDKSAFLRMVRSNSCSAIALSFSFQKTTAIIT